MQNDRVQTFMGLKRIPEPTMEGATRAHPYTVPRPLSGNCYYNIPGGSVVRVLLKDQTCYEGVMFINPSKLRHHDSYQLGIIKLLHASKVSPETDLSNVKSKSHSAPSLANGLLEFTFNEIDKVNVLKCGPSPVMVYGEMKMETFVVSNKVQLDSLMAALKEGGVTEVGLKFFGESQGRFMNLWWILLCTAKTLIPIDMAGELNCPEVWNDLKVNLFERSDIVKILHDLRSEADFLFHSKIGVIHLRNVFDTQMAVYFLDVRRKVMAEWVEKVPEQETSLAQTKNTKEEQTVYLNRLSVCLQRFLSCIVWDKEVAFLHSYEIRCWYDAKMLDRPRPPSLVVKAMALSVKYLSLLKAELERQMLKCYHSCCQKLMHVMQSARIPNSMKYLEMPGYCPKEMEAHVKYWATVLNVEKERSLGMENLISSLNESTWKKRGKMKSKVSSTQ